MRSFMAARQLIILGAILAGLMSGMARAQTPAMRTDADNGASRFAYGNPPPSTAPKKSPYEGTNTKTDEPWYSWFWPLGDRTEVQTIRDEYVPFTTEKDQMASRDDVLAGKAKLDTSDATTPAGKAKPSLLPERPQLMLEAGNGFLDTGPLDGGFEVPILGAVWQPRLWAYAINRTALQTFSDGRSGRQRETEIANRLDFFVNLQLTGTEKILLGLRPTDNNRPDSSHPLHVFRTERRVQR